MTQPSNSLRNISKTNMRLDKATHWVERFVFPLSRVLHKLALGSLMLMMLLTVGDVVGRYLVGWLPLFKPIPGTLELTEFMMVIIVYSALGYTQVCREHISIDVVVSRFSPWAQSVIDSIIYLFSLVLLSIVTWQSAAYAHRIFEEHDISGVLSLPVYPVLMVVTFGSFIFCLTMLVSLLISLAKVGEHES